MAPDAEVTSATPSPEGEDAARWTFVGHVHTNHSFDSLTTPRALATRATARKIDVLAVTDHDTWGGAVETADQARELGLPLRVIMAAEYATDQGDLIGFFLREPPSQRSALGLCDEIHQQGGLVMLPHPYRWHRLDEELLARVDLIEVYNARSLPGENAMAWELALERNLPGLAGSDAHRLVELDLARVEFEGSLPPDEAGIKEALLKAPRHYFTAHGSIWNEWLSQAVVMLKYPSGRRAWSLARGAVRRMVKPGDYALR
jgi:predicted metal-dependent phosphoesterase TrpH